MDTDTAVIDQPTDTSAASSNKPSATSWDDGLARAAAAHEAAEKGLAQPKKPDPAPQKKPEPAQPKPANRSLDAIKPKADAAAKPDATTAKAGATTTDDDDQKSQTRWQALKAAEKELAELKPKWADYESKRAEWERQQSEWQTKVKDYEDLSKQRDFREYQTRPEWQEKVEAPYAKVMDFAEQVAEYAQVPIRELVAAMNERNPMVREDKIRAVLEAGKNEIKPGNIATLVQHGDELGRIADESRRLQANATQAEQQYKNAQAAEKLKTDTEAQEVMKKAYKEIRDTIKTRAGDVLTDEQLEEAFQNVTKRGHDPMDRAFRHASEFLVPHLIEEVRKARAEAAQRQADLDAALKSKPGVRPTKEAPKKEGMSLDEAVARHKEAGHPV